MKRICSGLWMMLAAWVLGAHGAPLPAEVEINGVEFVRIPGGSTFLPVPTIDPKTGFPVGSGERQVRVEVDGYYIGKYEARARDFLRFMREGAPEYAAHYDAPKSTVAGSGAADGCAVRKDAAGQYTLVSPEADLPVTHLSWFLADEFARWMGFRLPTEAEWVRAFRGESKRLYPWGDEYPDDTYAAFQEGATTCHVQPVTGYPKGVSPFGVYNMAGNVFEYVADWYNIPYYNTLRDGVRNPRADQPHVLTGEPAAYKVLRGGRWASGPAELQITGNRDTRAPDMPFICFGARFAVDESVVSRRLAEGAARVIAR